MYAQIADGARIFRSVRSFNSLGWKTGDNILVRGYFNPSAGTIAWGENDFGQNVYILKKPAAGKKAKSEIL